MKNCNSSLGSSSLKLPNDDLPSDESGESGAMEVIFFPVGQEEVELIIDDDSFSCYLLVVLEVFIIEEALVGGVKALVDFGFIIDDFVFHM